MIAVVTGAASGLGAAAARRLAASGCRVVAVDLPSAAERGGELVSELGGGDAALFAGADVSDEAQVAAALDACESRFGAPSVLVQCAGIGDARRTLSKKGPPHSLAAFEKVTRVNTFGTFNVLCLTAERMAARDADADATSARGRVSARFTCSATYLALSRDDGGIVVSPQTQVRTVLDQPSGACAGRSRRAVPWRFFAPTWPP